MHAKSRTQYSQEQAIILLRAADGYISFMILDSA